MPEAKNDSGASTTSLGKAPGSCYGVGNFGRKSGRFSGGKNNGNPSVGSIAQTDAGASGLGHVAVVESVNGDSTITVTESSYSTSSTSTWNFLWRHRTVSQVWFTHFIHILKATPTLVDSEEAEVFLPSMYSLGQNFPNPFNPSTVILYTLPSGGLVTLRIFNLLGQEVALLVNERKEAGYYQATWSASNVPSGVYFYRLQAGEFVQTKKAILLK